MKKFLSGIQIIFLLLVFFFALFNKAYAETYTFENATQRTTASYNTQPGQLQVDGSKIYYVGRDRGFGSYHEIWTGEMNTDGTGFAITRRTNSGFEKSYPQFYVAGSKIYYVWGQDDGPVPWSSVQQIWTAEMNTDGTGWTATQRTTSTNDYYGAEIFVSGSKIYYVWSDSNGEIWTGEMNTDGTGWVATQRTTSGFYKQYQQFQIVGSKIYYVWQQDDGSGKYQIWTAEMNTDGTGWSATQRTTTNDNWWPQLKVDGTKIYYTWGRFDNDFWSDPYNQIWTASMNTDGTGWVESQRTTSTFRKDYPSNIQIEGSKLFFGWTEVDGDGYPQVWTGEMNTDGTGWEATQRTTSAFEKYAPQFKIDGSKTYYVWVENSGYDQLWTADGNESGGGSTQSLDESSTVTATVPSSLSFTIAGVSSGAACANSGGNASVTSNSSSIPFGVYSGAQTKIACQTLTVSTNAGSGYIVSVQQNRDLTNAGANTMGKFTGTYAVPAVWTSPISPNKSFFGFTTDDSDLSNFQTAKYSQLSANNTPYTVIQETTSVADEVNIISYQLEVNNLQEAGIYSNTLMYIVTGTF